MVHGRRYAHVEGDPSGFPTRIGADIQRKTSATQVSLISQPWRERGLIAMFDVIVHLAYMLMAGFRDSASDRCTAFE